MESIEDIVDFTTTTSDWDNFTSSANCTNEKLKFLFIQYCFNGLFGLTVCILGVIMNTTLLTILARRELRSTYLIYLAALAVLDLAVAITYVMVMCVQVLHEYFDNYFLYHIWHICLPYFFTLSRVVTLASTYMVVVCTTERFLEVVQLARHCDKPYKVSQKTRLMIIAAVILLSTAFRFVVFWELQLETREECRGTFGYYNLSRTWLIQDFYYSKVYAFYALHIIQVFFPFAALLLLNAMIIRKWRFALRKASVRNTDEIIKRVKSAQSARKMMAAIVASYLICNLLNLILTFLEHIDKAFLNRHDIFYQFASDTVTMLTVVNASFRLPIYYASNLKIRTQVRRLFGNSMKPVRAVSKSWTSKKPRPNLDVKSGYTITSSDGGNNDEAMFDETTMLRFGENGVNSFDKK